MEPNRDAAAIHLEKLQGLIKGEESRYGIEKFIKEHREKIGSLPRDADPKRQNQRFNDGIINALLGERSRLRKELNAALEKLGEGPPQKTTQDGKYRAALREGPLAVLEEQAEREHQRRPDSKAEQELVAHLWAAVPEDEAPLKQKRRGKKLDGPTQKRDRPAATLDVLEWRFHEEMTVVQLARALGLSGGTIQKRIKALKGSKAVKRPKRRYEPDRYPKQINAKVLTAWIAQHSSSAQREWVVVLLGEYKRRYREHVPWISRVLAPLLKRLATSRQGKEDFVDLVARYHDAIRMLGWAVSAPAALPRLSNISPSDVLPSARKPRPH